MWTDSLAIHFIVTLLAGLAIFIAGLRWRSIVAYLSRDLSAFRRLFGRGAAEAGILTVTLDTYRDFRLLSPEAGGALGIQPTEPSSPAESRFFKTFPDGRRSGFAGEGGDILTYSSARAAASLIAELAPLVSVRVVPDVDVSSQWSGTFVNIGGSASNVKTDVMKRFEENGWLLDDRGEFTFKDGRRETIEERRDKGVILKLPNPYFRGYSLIACAGLGEWGTSGAACFLAREWRKLARRFGSNSFLVLVGITPGIDQSGREIFALGRETLRWRMACRLRLWKQKAGSLRKQV